MRPRQRIDPNDPVPLRLSQREHKLLIDEVSILSELEDKLRIGTVEGKAVVLRLTLDELDELMGYIAFVANHTEDRKLQQRLDRLCGRVSALLDRYTDEEEATDAAGPEPVLPGAEDTEETAAQFDAVVAEAARQLESELGGLSLLETVILCGSDWEDPVGAVRLNEELALSELQGAELLVNARLFLQASVDSGGHKATAKGNLTRKAVAELLDRLDYPPDYLEAVRAVNKVINEYDVFPVHILRILLELAGLIRRRKGVFRASKKARSLLAEDQAGALYALLFRTHFRKFNLAYLDMLPEVEDLQATIAYSLFMVGCRAREWITPRDLAPLVLIPIVQAELASHPSGIALPRAATARVLDPLESFGLLERRDGPVERPWTQSYEVRKTELFDRFIEFHLAGLDSPLSFGGPQ